ncbi:hypothetical protein QN399_26035 [Pseudomonas sp. 10C3]|uniref:hypothetical protein n=1 Tax=Pseudomonas sp. 10C3 TaxID=3118753 RepID=UPI002E81F138|nr:hypothetical protein [Pseudomonas sp. 10C3]MEE3509654.1 hypothetical protein [Pseudomonas sp. 10C3]
MSKTEAVDYLIREAKEHTMPSAAQLACVEALGEAGGNEAIGYLMAYADDARRETPAHSVALKALGRAARNG